MQRLRAGRPAGPKRAEQGRAETASYRGGTSRGESTAPFPLSVSYEEITRRFNYYSAARVLAVQRAAANLNRAPQKARSARPPHFRPKDARGLRRRPVHAYKQAVRLKRPKKAAHRAPATRSIQKGYPPRAHTTEAYLKAPLPTYRAWSSQGGGRPTGGLGGPGAAKFRLLGGGGTPPRFGSSCW